MKLILAVLTSIPLISTVASDMNDAVGTRL